jgi:hypothetical protein
MNALELVAKEMAELRAVAAAAAADRALLAQVREVLSGATMLHVDPAPAAAARIAELERHLLDVERREAEGVALFDKLLAEARDERGIFKVQRDELGRQVAKLEQEAEDRANAALADAEVVARIAASLRDMERLEGAGTIHDVEVAVAGLIEDYQTTVDDDADRPKGAKDSTNEVLAGEYAEDAAAAGPPPVEVLYDDHAAGPFIIQRESKTYPSLRWHDGSHYPWNGDRKRAKRFETIDEARRWAAASSENMDGSDSRLCIIGLGAEPDETKRVGEEGVFVVTRVNAKPTPMRVFRTPSEAWGPLDRAQWYATRELAEASKPRGAKVVTLAEAPTLGVGKPAELPLPDGAAGDSP